MSEYATTNLVPPHSTDAERSVLGAMMQSNTAVSLVMEMLEEDDFYIPANREVFKAAKELVGQSMAVDLVTLNSKLTEKGMINGIGGTDYLIDLSNFVPSTQNVGYYIRIVQEKSTLRKLIAAGNQMSRESYAQTEDLPTILNHAEKSVFDIVMRRTGEYNLHAISEVLPATYDKIEEFARLKGGVSGVPTGYYELDNLLTGLHGGELIIVGARPAMGKTSFAINMACHAASKGKKVAIFSLEMPRIQIAIRMLCGEARVSMQKVRNGTLRDEEWVKLARAAAPMADSNVIYIDDTAGLSPAQLRSRCRRMMMEKGLDLIVIDYLQLMTADGKSKNDNRQQEVGEISRALKSIALELKVPLVACAQLSRANTQRTVKKPMLNDLRESGSIEQDADVVMFLHREGYYDDTIPEDKKNIAEVIIAKQRNGSTGTVKLAWIPEYTLFDNLGYIMK
ncbi:MAG: replicative DNA helicase [Clostridiales bacterium]|nr:replicative DNA helicase [Clostridiales bacterium]